MLILILLANCQKANAFLRVSNGEFVNARNKPIFLRGVGLGGWLVPEGYMLHMPGFGSPSSIKAQIADVIGAENSALFWENYRKNYVAHKDIQEIARLGFNSIRLPFNYRLLSPEDQPGVYLEEGFAYIDSLISWCAQEKLYLVLDMHCAPGGQNADNISDSDGQEARLWTDAQNRERTVQIWRTIAQRYAQDTTIIGYDLLNEPVLPAGHSANELRQLYMEITSAIRSVDQNHIIFVEGNNYATDFQSLTPPWDANMAYSFHKYWNETTISTIQSYLNIRKTYKMPLWMGESGENSNHWFASVVQLLEQNNISWCWWTHKKFETTTSPYSAQLPTGFDVLVDYWNGTGNKPSQAYALSVLLFFAQNLAIEKCTFRKDVPRALFDSQFLTKSAPFNTHRIPGTIDCVDFDFGGNGVAYSDQNFERTHWDAPAWNIGGKYRNDGVDIEESNDADGAFYSIGWIEDGEWLAYTVEVQTTGTYDLKMRIAAPQAGGQVQLKINDQPVGEALSIPATGGWYAWDTVIMNNIALNAGTQKLILVFLKGGFNLNWLEFVLKTAVPSTGLPGDFELGQNYPNPFNGYTRIPIQTGSVQPAELLIFDIHGKLVFKHRKVIERKGFFVWEGIDLQNRAVSSGIYFYQVKIGQRVKTRRMLCLR